MRLAAFVMVVLLLGGWVDPDKGYLIALTAVSGLAMFIRTSYTK